MQGMNRKTLAALALFTVAANVGAEPMADDARLAAALSAQFGGHQAPSYQFAMGSTLGLSDELQTESSRAQLPISGIAYSSTSGFNPMILGLTVLPRSPSLLSKEEDSSWSLGWIAAGTAVIVGAVIVAVSGGGADDGSNSGDNPQGGGGVACTDGECVIPCNSTGPLLTCNTD